MLRYLFFMVLLSLGVVFYVQSKETSINENARWEYLSAEGVMQRIVKVDDYWVETHFEQENSAFIRTFGGKWSVSEDSLIVEIHFDSNDSTQVGNSNAYELKILEDGSIELNGITYEYLQSENESKLVGAWFINGRMRDGELQSREFRERRTLKILSESSFQWVAYHVGTGVFSGSGGGLYETTDDGKYIEKIQFFSRDSSRVGAELSFDYEIKEGIWHHQGLSSRGQPIYETWARFPDQW